MYQITFKIRNTKDISRNTQICMARVFSCDRSLKSDWVYTAGCQTVLCHHSIFQSSRAQLPNLSTIPFYTSLRLNKPCTRNSGIVCPDQVRTHSLHHTFFRGKVLETKGNDIICSNHMEFLCKYANIQKIFGIWRKLYSCNFHRKS